MFPLSQMLSKELLIRDMRSCRTANIFGLIAYTEGNPYVVKVLRDKDFWNSLNSRTKGWILYAVKPDSHLYGGGNADYVDMCLNLKPEDYPQLIIFSMGSDKVLMQRNYPIESNNVESTYNSIEGYIDVITRAVKRIYPEYLQSTNVHREAIKALDAELATKKWHKAASGMKDFVMSLIFH